MRRLLFALLLSVYLAVVLWLTLRSRTGPANEPLLVPLVDTWRQMRDLGNRVALEEATRNVLLCIPLGYLLPATFRGLRSFRATIATGAAIAVFIETMQWLFVEGRSPSIDDVIYNTTGTGIGAALFILLTGLWRHRRDRRGQAAAVSAGGRSDGRLEKLVQGED